MLCCLFGDNLGLIITVFIYTYNLHPLIYVIFKYLIFMSTRQDVFLYTFLLDYSIYQKINDKLKNNVSKTRNQGLNLLRPFNFIIFKQVLLNLLKTFGYRYPFYTFF